MQHLKKILKFILKVIGYSILLIVLCASVIFALRTVGIIESSQFMDKALFLIEEVKVFTLIFRLGLYTWLVLVGYKFFVSNDDLSNGNTIKINQAKYFMATLCVAHEFIVVQRLFIG